MATDTAPSDVFGVPTDEEALALVSGGEREIPKDSDEAKLIAQRIKDSAAAHANWRESLPMDQQLALRDTPTATVPPTGDAEPVSEPSTDNGGAPNAGV